MLNTAQLKKLLDGPTEEERAKMELLRKAKEKELIHSLCNASGMTDEDAALLLRFAKAAGNLYGRIPLGDFYRIVKELAPEIQMEKDAFLSFMRALDNKEYLYVVELADRSKLPDTVTMDCELATEWVACDFANAYDVLLERHAKCPRYVPKREEFLRYAEDDYYEETPAKQKMRNFLMEVCGLQGEDLEDWLQDVLCSLHISTDLTPEKILEHSANCYCFKQDIIRQIISHSQEFAQCVGELYEHMRFVYTNAYTLAELRKMQTITDIEVEPEVDFSEYELMPGRNSKIGRNDPCPCGSGKKHDRKTPCQGAFFYIY